MTTAAASARSLQALPSPPGLPWVGHLTRLRRADLHRQFEDWARELGTPYRLDLGPVTGLVIDDIEWAQQILRERPQRWRRTSRIRQVTAEIGLDGLFSAEGSDWEPQRRLVMQALHPGHLREFYPTLQAITARLHRRWQAAAERGTVFEMHEDLTRYTVDVTSALAFGEDPNTLEQDGDRIQQHLAMIFPMLMRRLVMPLPYWRWLRLPVDRRLDRHLAAVHAHIAGLIDRTRQRLRQEPDRPPRNLLESFLQQQALPGSSIGDDTVSANMLTVLLAGEDTTATSLSWTMPYLAADRAWQARLAEEARAALGQAAVCPDPAALRQLDRCEAAVTEAQRLRPVAALQTFQPLQDTVLAGLAIPRGTQVYFINRPGLLDPRHFHDPHRYDPERWLRPRDRQPGAHEPRAFLQFGAGPRVCPGRHLAGVEIRLVMSMLMRDFEVELAIDPGRIDEVSAFTMQPSRMPVRLHRR